MNRCFDVTVSFQPFQIGKKALLKPFHFYESKINCVENVHKHTLAFQLTAWGDVKNGFGPLFSNNNYQLICYKQSDRRESTYFLF